MSGLYSLARWKQMVMVIGALGGSGLGPRTLPHEIEIPAIEELMEGLLRRVRIAAQVSFTEHLIQMSLSVPQTAVDGLIQISAFLVSGSRPLYTRTSQTRSPRRTI